MKLSPSNNHKKSSIRIPSAFCGIYGLRPSYGRVPYSGLVNSMEGQDSIPSVLGPLSSSIHGIKSFLQGVVSQEPWLKDSLVVRKRWNEDEYRLIEHGEGKQLCFAILWDDGNIVPHPPIIRGLEMTKKALLAAGHKGARLPICFNIVTSELKLNQSLIGLRGSTARSVTQG